MFILSLTLAWKAKLLRSSLPSLPKSVTDFISLPFVVPLAQCLPLIVTIRIQIQPHHLTPPFPNWGSGLWSLLLPMTRTTQPAFQSMLSTSRSQVPEFPVTSQLPHLMSKATCSLTFKTMFLFTTSSKPLHIHDQLESFFQLSSITSVPPLNITYQSKA